MRNPVGQKVNPRIAGIVLLAAIVAVAAAVASCGGGIEFAPAGAGGADGALASASGEGSAAGEGADGEASEDVSGAVPETIIVHVAGAVARPGIYELAAGSRVGDAIDAAGGFASDAATDRENLARVLSDGEQVRIMTVAQADAAWADASSSADASTGGKVNINTATGAELESLPGIGSATAEKIIAYRTQNGPFASPEDIKNVSGIGERKYEALEGLIAV